MKKVCETNNRKVIRYMKNFGFVNQVCKLESQAKSSELKKFKNKKGSAQSPAYRMTISCIETDSEKQ